MAGSLLVCRAHHQIPGVVLSSSLRRPLSRHRVAGVPLPPAEATVLKLRALRARQRSSVVAQAMPPSGADAGEPRNGGSPSQTNPGVSPRPASGPRLPLPNIPIWARWVLGSIICLAIPFYKRILSIGAAVDSVVEVTEEVAKVTKKVAEEVAEALPEGGSLKNLALQVEEIAEKVAEEAEQLDSFIHKVDEIKDEMEALAEPIIQEAEENEKEALVEPIIEQAEEIEKEGK